MPYQISLLLPVGPDVVMPSKYYDSYVGHFSDAIDKPFEAALGTNFNVLHGMNRTQAISRIEPWILLLKAHSESTSTAYEMALQVLKVLRDRFGELPKAIIDIRREGRSALGDYKSSGLTLGDLDAGMQADGENLAGPWDYTDDDE